MGSQEFHDLANVTQAMIRKGSRPSREPESTSRRPACSARRRGSWGSRRRRRAPAARPTPCERLTPRSALTSRQSGSRG